MDGEGLGTGPLTDVTALAGGTQNVMVRFTRGDRSYVFRRGPRHLRPKSNDNILREGRVLSALDGSPVPHPGFIAACADTGVLGDAAFYLMEPVDGFNPTVAVPELHRGSPDVQHRMGLSAAEAIAHLGRIDPDAVGLGDLGKPGSFLERQVPRWLSELEGYSKHEGYPGPDIPGVHDVAAWLDANRPPDQAPGISHGDYHLANLMYRFDGGDVAAVVDWEMCTVGDPLLDLGWLLSMWGHANLPHLPSEAELVAAYAAVTARDLSAVDWYIVLACFKLGIVLEGTHARAFAGRAPKDIGDMLHATTLALFARAHEVIRSS
jgi:aminoglycoside phosphotransferase (APT) family kinase protein